MINIPKGTKDVTPSQSYKWQYIEAHARRLAQLFNVREIRTPVFEHTELFLRSIGDETDVVSKEMYTFNDRGGRSITLKPEGTAPAARCFVENSLDQLESLPLKTFYITPVFRYDRPQAGRYREHHQFGAEIYGSASYLMDAELIHFAYTFLSEIGVKNSILNLNSIGCPKCRGNYNEALRGFAAANMEHMCPTCAQRYEKNPLRMLDCKVENCKKILQNSPKIIDYICSDCSAHFEGLKLTLQSLNIPFVVNPSIVRGLDYYTKTVFEFVTDLLGAQGSIGAGGRYDNMVESIGGRATPCVGFGIGIERLILLMEASGIDFGKPISPKIYIAPCSEAEINECLRIVARLRAASISAETDFMSRSVKAQLKYADKIKAEYTAVIGADELSSGYVSIKRMSDGTIKKVDIKKVVEFIQKSQD